MLAEIRERGDHRAAVVAVAGHRLADEQAAAFPGVSEVQAGWSGHNVKTGGPQIVRQSHQEDGITFRHQYSHARMLVDLHYSGDSRVSNF